MTIAAGSTRTIDLPRCAREPRVAYEQGAEVQPVTAGNLDLGQLIDDTEGTNWAGVNASASVDATSPFVAVDLAGAAPATVRRVQVSRDAAARSGPAPPTCRCCAAWRTTPTPAPGSPRCAGSRSRPAPTSCGSSATATLEADLHQRGRRLPGHDPAPGRAEPDDAVRSTSRTPRPPPSGWSPWRTSAPGTPGTPASRTTTRSTTPTARRPRTPTCRCAPPSSRSSREQSRLA